MLFKYNKDILINKYKDAYNFDISYIFKDIKEIEMYKCLDSDFVFFHPKNISGDSYFYEQLSKNDWYYMEDKWEHRQVKKIIKKVKQSEDFGNRMWKWIVYKGIG